MALSLRMMRADEEGAGTDVAYAQLSPLARENENLIFLVKTKRDW